ncbi:hypothetical protein ANN_20962 [Periplaneta americana]|uniref:MULE transposase domain-containing protein n=1 Tax=Periplaneta americana TaxID=6978 RepID=A0ABQ8SE21_PERAM|nr:hypothetical protein ANN_20962 [Periplaneta americana]
MAAASYCITWTQNSSELFEVLKSEVRRQFERPLAPNRICTNYETEAISAVKEAFPNSIISGCLFHFEQAFWRRLQAGNLREEYLQEGNEDILDDFHSLIAVAFIPEEDVLEIFDSLADNAHDSLAPIFNHIGDTYAGGVVTVEGCSFFLLQRGTVMIDLYKVFQGQQTCVRPGIAG